VALTSKRKQH